MTVFKVLEYDGDMTVKQVIDKLGGNREVAELLGVTPPAVSNWKAFGRFPERLHFRLYKICQDRGIELPESLFSRREDAA